MSEKQLLEKIPTEFLPENWREKGMQAFGVKTTKIESVVYGLDRKTPKNLKIWEFMLCLAEDGKKRAIELEQNLSNRLKALVS